MTIVTRLYMVFRGDIAGGFSRRGEIAVCSLKAGGIRLPFRQTIDFHSQIAERKYCGRIRLSLRSRHPVFRSSARHLRENRVPFRFESSASI